MILLYYAIRFYELILIARILMSWIQPNENHPVVRWVYRLTDPVLDPVRRALPLNAGGMDFSPIIVFIILDMLKRLVIPTGIF
jgi:YggT family protein